METEIILSSTIDLLNASGYTTAFSAHLMINTIVGESYTVYFDVLDISSQITGFGAINCPVSTVNADIAISSPGSYNVTFTATSSVSRLKWFNASPANGYAQIVLSNVFVNGPGDILGTGISTPAPQNYIAENHKGDKLYELTNHLGNVLATITDRKIYNPTGQYYEPVITMKADYYAFGMLMPNRYEGIDESRHLFNGMEHDGELSGNGNSYTTEFRQYDPRLGRWKSLDPLMMMFPQMSPYVAFDNNPIYYNDPKGLAAEGGDDPEGGDDANGGGETFIGDNGIVYSTTHGGGTVIGEKRENSMTLTLTKDYEEPDFVTKVGNLFRDLNNKMKGNAKWSFGIELKTHDGEQQGNYEDASKAEKDAFTWVVYWDDIEELETALKRLDKELPKEFRNSPTYSGPDTFIKEAKKWIGPAQEGKQMSKQMAGKNIPKIKKQDDQIIQDSGGSYMYENGIWYRREVYIKDSTYFEIESNIVPDDIKNKLK